jgi:hypothetical protein
MDEGWIKLTQPVLMQSYVDEFELPEGEMPRMPTTPGTSVLQRGKEKDHVNDRAIYLQIGSGKAVAHDEMDEARDFECRERTV